MLKNEYDIVVVGAGPGGSITAMHLAKKGFKVALLEKRQEIGAPKRCGEGLPLTADEIIKLGVPDFCKRQDINGAIVAAPNGKTITVNMGKLAGHVVERKDLDKWLAFEAARAGAYVQAKTEAIDVIKENDYITGVRVSYENEEHDIKCKILVAADGIESVISRKAGLNTTNQLLDVESGFQFEMANVKIDDPMKLQLFFGKDIAPRGYIWIFPKGKDIANVGIGIAPSSESARYYLEKWIESKPEIFGNASIIEVNAGGIPVGGLLENMVLNGFATVGDAAHQVNAIHGGGLHESTTAGRILAGVIERCIKKNDVSQEALSEYNKLWWEERGNRLQKVQKLRELFDKLNDADMNTIAGSVNGDDLLNLARGSKAIGLGKLLLRNPRLLGLMKHFL
ncbi:MAG: NAD(P)/FAD-dependent oxidoreductase [Nanoarchaeota archaeon]|nr:NAD(P)/FAD-dependent oxidoreductase [Nanoarchaeota archaeon]MBU4033123.1 NAD(P)/FAD-dependent oxidoreductase [Candidatus Thermoplasmatota archaeon]MBU4123888.1 NAD(P)/FAD-dependent oxidoreductase [Nanoarchaeota archaeon]